MERGQKCFFPKSTKCIRHHFLSRIMDLALQYFVWAPRVVHDAQHEILSRGIEEHADAEKMGSITPVGLNCQSICLTTAGPKAIYMRV